METTHSQSRPSPFAPEPAGRAPEEVTGGEAEADQEAPAEAELTEDEARALDVLDRCCRDDGFPHFVREVFSLSVDIFKDHRWVGGDFVEDVSAWLGSNPKTIRVSARDHMKSMLFYAHIMWKVFRSYFLRRPREIAYFSYKESMAGYHLAKVKKAIRCNPYFRDVVDHKPLADSVLCYSWDGRAKVTVTPYGLLEFKRGLHAQDVYVDDPFQDPGNKLVPSKILQVNDVMRTQVLDMFQNECHVAGTAQTNHDFFFDDAFAKRFSRRVMRAMVDEANRVALWPEWMTFEELEAKRAERGEKAFNQEYLCSPAYAENSYVDKAKLAAAVDPRLPNHTPESWAALMVVREAAEEETDTDKVGGWDLGKKGHPAHFSCFERREGKRIQICDRWFDGEDYTAQLAWITRFCDAVGVYRCYYDNTRGELEVLAESGALPSFFEPVHFTHQGKHKMAAQFEREISAGTCKLVNVQRSQSQYLLVNNELQCPETPEGHGDCFWSAAMTCLDAEEGGADVNFY